MKIIIFLGRQFLLLMLYERIASSQVCMQVFFLPAVDLLEQELTTMPRKHTGNSLLEARMREKDEVKIKQNREAGPLESRRC